MLMGAPYRANRCKGSRDCQVAGSRAIIGGLRIAGVNRVRNGCAWRDMSLGIWGRSERDTLYSLAIDTGALFVRCLLKVIHSIT